MARATAAAALVLSCVFFMACSAGMMIINKMAPPPGPRTTPRETHARDNATPRLAAGASRGASADHGRDDPDGLHRRHSLRRAMRVALWLAPVPASRRRPALAAPRVTGLRPVRAGT